MIATSLTLARARTAPSVARTLPADPSTWLIGDVDAALESLLPNLVGGLSGYTSNRAYLDGDHFQDARNWKGPGWTTAGMMADSDKKAIEQALTPVPEVEECVDCRKDGVCGTEAEVSCEPRSPSGPQDDEGNTTPSAAEEQAREQWKRDVGAWWRRVDFWKYAKQAFDEASIAGSGCVRLIPLPASEDEEGQGTRRFTPRLNREAALLEIECTAPRADACGVYTHPDTFQRIAVWRGKDVDGTTDLAEVWYADSGATVFRKIRGEAVTERRYPAWGGLLPIVALNLQPIITNPVRDLQGALDTVSSGLLNNAVMHGYTQRNEIDVLPPGEWVKEQPAGQSTFYTKQADGVTWYYKESGTRVLGAKVTVNMFGIETLRKGSEQSGTAEYEYQSPQVQYHEPSDPANIIRPAEWYQDRIREACKQGHRSGGSTAEASGDAYEQKRARHVADLRTCGGEVAGFVERVMMALTVIADWMSGANEPTFLREWEVSATVHTDAGPVSSGKMQQIGEWMDKSRLSRSTAWKMIGLRDAEVEEERIAHQSTLAVVKERAEAAGALIDTAADRKAAWLKAGFTEQEADAFSSTDGFVVEQ